MKMEINYYSRDVRDAIVKEGNFGCYARVEAVT